LSNHARRSPGWKPASSCWCFGRFVIDENHDGHSKCEFDTRMQIRDNSFVVCLIYSSGRKIDFSPSLPTGFFYSLLLRDRVCKGVAGVSGDRSPACGTASYRAISCSRLQLASGALSQYLVKIDCMKGGQRVGRENPSFYHIQDTYTGVWLMEIRGIRLCARG
jgi:hypothetical protein